MIAISDDLRAGDVLLYKAKGLFGWIISIKSGSTITHVELYDGDGNAVASRDGLGVNRYPLRIDQLAYVLRPTTPYDHAAVTKWVDALIASQTKYGWIDLANFILPDVQVDSSGMFCSEFAIGALRIGGIKVAHKEPAVKVSPRDFRLFDALEEIWPEDTRSQPDAAA